MLLANPIWLWALAGLSIPIAIHLLSRKEGKVIRIGSLRHLQETNTQQFKGIRLNEIVLLALRCALIVLFVLMLCGLSYEKERNAEVKWVLIEKGLEDLPEIKTQIDTFRNNEYEIRWLSEGFPLFEDSASVVPNILYWKLITQLQEEKAEEVVVISKNNLNNFKGQRPQLPANIRWIGMSIAASDFIVKANMNGDSIVVRKGHAQTDKTYFTTQISSRSNWDSSIQLTSPDSIDVVIVADKAHQYDKQIVEASLQALRLTYPIKMKIQNGSPEKINTSDSGTWYFWLADQPVSDSIKSNVIQLKPAINRKILVQEKSNRWVITKRLNEEVALTDNFVVNLGSLLLSNPKDWDVASLNDKRMLADESLWSDGESTGAKDASLVVQSADSYLIIIFLITLLIERILAYYRNQ